MTLLVAALAFALSGLARGEAEPGFQQVGELIHAKGVAFLGSLPARIQAIAVYAAGLHAAAPSPDAALERTGLDAP